MTGQVYALASGKGGVGKTAMTANLGITLRAEGYSVALVDADFGMANLTTLLDVETGGTVHDVLAGEATVEAALAEEAAGFTVLPGTRELSGFAEADPDGFDAVLDHLAADHDFVLVDTGAGLSYEGVLPLGMVDGVILVTTPGPAAVGDTAKTTVMTDLVGGEVVGVIVNRSREDTDAAAIADELGVALLGSVPEDRSVAESALAGQPLRAHAPESPAAAALGRIAGRLAGDWSDGETAERGVDAPAEAATADAPAGADTRGEERGAGEPAPAGADGEDPAGPATPGEGGERSAESESSGGVSGWLSRIFG